MRVFFATLLLLAPVAAHCSRLDEAFDVIDLSQQSRRITSEQILPMALAGKESYVAAWKLLMDGYLCGIEAASNREGPLGPLPEIKCLKHRVPGYPQCRTFLLALETAQNIPSQPTAEVAVRLSGTPISRFHSFCLGDEDGLLDARDRPSVTSAVDRIKPGQSHLTALQQVFGAGGFCVRISTDGNTDGLSLFCGSQYDFRAHAVATGIEIQLRRTDASSWAVVDAKDRPRLPQY